MHDDPIARDPEDLPDPYEHDGRVAHPGGGSASPPPGVPDGVADRELTDDDLRPTCA